MEGYVIREFRPEDLEAVVNINRRCLPENYPPFFFMEHYRNYPKAFLVAEVGDEVVGYVMCRVEHGLSNLKLGLARKGHIISIAVMPWARRRGIGRALMVGALRALREHYDVEEYYLEVRVSNMPAISLYEKLGFKKVKVLRHYYLDNEDAYLMAMSAENINRVPSL